MVEETITSGTRQAMRAQSETDALGQSVEVPPARARGTARRIAALAARNRGNHGTRSCGASRWPQG